MTLDPVQLRILGALIEKEITTPENYPLSLNSLIAACNQRSSRDPVLDLSEDEVRQAVHSLEDMGIVAPVRDARVPKYEHRIRTILNLRRDETAIVCLLLLRGPQTPGELRGRADRMYSFDDIGSVQTTLERLANRANAASPDTPADQATPLVVQLARQPGSRESRYAHLLGGPVAAASDRSTMAQRHSIDGEDLRDQRRPDFELKAEIDRDILDRLGRLETVVSVLEARIRVLEEERAGLQV